MNTVEAPERAEIRALHPLIDREDREMTALRRTGPLHVSTQALWE